MKKLKIIGLNARKAFQQINDLNPKIINKVLNNQGKTSGGFIWKFKKQ